MNEDSTQNLHTGFAPIAVVGVSALFPGSIDATGFWRDILAGRDLITDVPPTHWLVDDYYDPDPSAPDKTYAKRGAFLEPIDFDALSWGVPPSIVPATDSSQLLALVVAEKVLEDATKGQYREMDRSRVSVILGVTSAQELYGSLVSRLQRPVWAKALRESGVAEHEVESICDRIAGHYVEWQEASFPGLLGNVIAGRIANRLDLGGTNCVTDAACASSFSALSMAVNELHLRQSDMVITGGVDTMNDILMFMCFSKTPAMSKSGDCRPFSATADGTMLGEGLGMVALKRLDDACRDGDRVYAVLRGCGSSSDGRAASVYAPVPAGQATAITRAYDGAGYSAQTVELIEAHGTGTTAGDAAEFEGLRLAFSAEADESTDRRQWCALGSVKSQIGHTKAAAGAAGLFKTVMALHHQVLPPTIKIDQPNPSLAIDQSPFYLNTSARPWVRDSHHPRRASVSSFGFGGSNFHLTLEECPAEARRAQRLRTFHHELVVLEAEDRAGLVAQARQMAEVAAASGALQWLSWQSCTQHHATASHRLSVVASNESQLCQRLKNAALLIEQPEEKEYLSAPQGIAFGCGEPDPQVALLFPGQGSQYLGMGASLSMAFGQALAPWNEAADLECFAEQGLHDVVFPRPVFSDQERAQQQARLTATEWAQPAIGCVSLSLLRMLRELGLSYHATAGHSFGELTALATAGVLSNLDMLRLARRRGELMAAAAEVDGAMVAVAAPLERLEPLLEGVPDVVVANHNAPQQVVLSGTQTGISDVVRKLEQEGVSSRRLPVSTAFHSPLVAGSCVQFGEFLSSLDLQPAQVPVYANLTAAVYPTDPRDVRDTLIQQISHPVRFLPLVEAMYDAGSRVFVEVGPGAVLSTLVGQILSGRRHLTVALDRKGQDGLETFLNGVGQLVAAGVPLDLAGLWRGFRAPADLHEAKRPGLSVKISGANYGKPYPVKGQASSRVERAPRQAPAAQSSDTKETMRSMHNDTEKHAPRPPQRHASDPVASDVLIDMQHQTARAHEAFVKAMAESHTAYLNAAQASLTALGKVAGRRQEAATFAEPLDLVGVSQVNGDTGLADVCPVPSHHEQSEPPAADEHASTTSSSLARVPSQSVDVRTLLLDVVATKTGYPQEMLSMEMDLEKDLGIDSIKRVEILSEVVERAPELEEVDASALVDLRTLGQIVEFLEQGTERLNAMPGSGIKLKPEEITSLLLDVVAAKTGYPQEMDLEKDLGIDSIKRVEILSEVVERVPELPEVDASAMVGLATLGEIAEHLTRGLSALHLLPEQDESDSGEEEPSDITHDFHQVLLDVVAEKTGYPAEMLRPEMDLEKDLGIDSIKRVEIMSAVADQRASLSTVDSAALIELHTLAEIAEYLSGTQQDSRSSSQQPPTQEDAEELPVPAELGRWVTVAQPSPPLGLVQQGLLDLERLVLVDDGEGVAAALADLLQHRGVPAVVANEVGEQDKGVVFLGGLRSISSIEDAVRVNREAFAVARKMAEAKVFITVQDTGGDFGLSGCEPERAWLAGLPGLVKTAALEWPSLSAKAIDLERAGRAPEELAAVLADELLWGSPQHEVGLPADGRRLCLASVEAALQPTQAPLAEADVVVVSGGARGVTAACVVELARRVRPRLLLLGRTRLQEETPATLDITGDRELKRAILEQAKGNQETLSPPELERRVGQILACREVRATLAACAEAGAEAQYEVVDITEPAAVAAACQRVRDQWGPIVGVVHGAGVIADRRLKDKSEQEFDQVFTTKVEGLRSLLAATEEDPLRLLCLFSSITARHGNPGQSDYAMANEVLNKVAAAEHNARGGRCVTKALGWGPWRGGMVTPEIERRFAQRGVPLISQTAGATLFCEEICAGTQNGVELIVGAGPNTSVPLSQSEASTPRVFDVLVDRQRYPFLVDHAINGVPVVPVVLVMEWFARVAAAVSPELKVRALTDITVLRGIRLDGFPERERRFVVQARPVANGAQASLELRLLSPDQTLHYCATADLVSERERKNGSVPELRLKGWDGRKVYGGVLFHGPSFQVIRSVEGFSDEGIVATVAGVTEAGWPSERFHTDPAAFDGGLQLALLWSEQVLGGASLPTRIDEVCSWTDEPPRGSLRCVLQGRRTGSSRAVADVLFQDGTGKVIAALKGVETHLRPSQTN